MDHHTPHHCGRFMSESDCVRSIFRSGVRLWATIEKAHDYHVTEFAKKNVDAYYLPEDENSDTSKLLPCLHIW